MEEEGDKPKSIDKLTPKQKDKLFGQLIQDKVDIEEEVKEGLTTKSEAEEELERIANLQSRLSSEDTKKK